MEEKWEKLREWFAENPKVLIGFSGGVDSAFLLAAAKECGAEALPVFIKTPFQPDFELRDAEQLAAFLGIKPEVLTADPLSDPEIMANGSGTVLLLQADAFFNAAAAGGRAGGGPD